MFEIFQAMTENRIKQGRKVYHLYDCSGSKFIESQKHYLEREGGTTLTRDLGNDWIAIYCNPKHK